MTSRKSLRGYGLSLSVALGATALAAQAQAETYQVGPGLAHSTLNEIQDSLAPGDVVEVQGGVTYPGNVWLKGVGTKEQPIIIRGIPVGGQRPILSGGDQWTILFHGSHTVFEGFEVTGGAQYCVVHKADDITIRDTIVHDCPQHGILSTDDESGSITIEYSEVYHCGQGMYYHQLYMASDETTYPGSVFRLQYSYIHDANGGNNVKSRAERNEIYFNWIEGAAYHELDLIGPAGQDPWLAREDSDIVGNVLIKTSEWRIARFGGDGTGSTSGRYRFVGNTMILDDSTTVALGPQQGVQSIELHNNVFFRHSDEPAQLILYLEPEGGEPEIVGSNNWIPTDWTGVPDTLGGTIKGSDPGLMNLIRFDLRPDESSPLVNAGTSQTEGFGQYPVPNAYQGKLYLPPPRKIMKAGSQQERPIIGAIDIGVYEYGTPAPDIGGPGSAGSGGGASGCACRQGASGQSSQLEWGMAAAMVALLLVRGRRWVG